MKYIKLFTNNAEYEEYYASEHPTPNVSLAVAENDVHYEPIPPHDYSQDYLTFIAKADGTFKFSGNSVNYSLDSGETWISLASNTNSPTVTSGNKIMWKATLTPRSGSTSHGIGTFTSSAKFDVEGNPMSLLFGDNFKGKTSLSGKDYAFYDLFSRNTNVVSADNMSLLATTLADNCYANMFSGCTSLTEAPQLPATTLANGCYANMFSGCTSLTTAPSVLPATTLANFCYNGMFGGCTSLTTAPSVLPATTLTSYCYSYMFSGCTSLTTAPQLLATTLASGCYSGMFYGCRSLATAPQLLATTLATQCCSRMFYDCKSLTTAPELPATTLAKECYYYMFYGCTSLTTAPSVLPATTLANKCCESMFGGCTSLTTAPSVLPATTLADSCYSYMFYGCTSLTTAPQLPATTLAKQCYFLMFGGCTSLNHIECLATDISADTCTIGWVSDVASSGTFVKAASMTSWTEGVSGIPSNWTVQDAS